MAEGGAAGGWISYSKLSITVNLVSGEEGKSRDSKMRV